MDFHIQANPSMGKNPRCISLPAGLLRDIRVIAGQFLQLQGAETIVLRVMDPLESNQQCAYVGPAILEILKATDVEFKVLDVTLGCDPEFFIMWGPRRISAATYLSPVGQVGSDGGLGELRPMYALHEDQVVNNLRNLIRSIPSSMKRLPWAEGFPLDGSEFTYEAYSYYQHSEAGFHVHLGIPPEILNTRRDFSRLAINHLIRCLDWYVSVPLVPLEEDHRRRLGTTRYGQPGDFRPSNTTLEYRTPGAFYLRSPALAQGVLGLSLMVTEIIVSRMKVISNRYTNLHKLSPEDLEEILPTPRPSVIKETLLHTDVGVALGHIPDIRERLRGLPNYKKHEHTVEGFFRAVEGGRRPEPNLLRNWR